MTIPRILAVAALFTGVGFSQNVTPQVQNDLEQYLGATVALSLRSAGATYGKAFSAAPALKVYTEGLRADKVIDEPEKSDCPIMAHIVNGHIRHFSGDYRVPQVLASIDKVMAMDEAALEVYCEKEHEKLIKRLAKGYRPIRKSRERKKEAEMVQMHAAQEGVVQLSNGILVSTSPGTDNIRDISRCTTETGVDYYTRVTNDTTFAQLPETVRMVADEMPAASSWTIWVPVEVEEKLIEQRKKEETAKTNALSERLARLAPGGPRFPLSPEEKRAQEEAKRKEAAELRKRLAETTNGLVATEEEMKAAQEARTQEETEEEADSRQLLRLHVWKEDPQNPVKVLPDVSESVI